MNDLNEFIQEVKEIRRSGNDADLVMWYNEHGQPVRLIGFSCDSKLTDFEIFEEGFKYYLRLYEQINKIKNEKDA